MIKVIRKIFIINLTLLFIITFQSKVWAESIKSNNSCIKEYCSYSYEKNSSFTNLDENNYYKLNAINNELQSQSGKKEFVQFGLGLLLEIIGGLIFYYLGGFISSKIIPPVQQKTVSRGGAGMVFAFIGIMSAILFGIPLGASLGVYIIGNTENETNSFLLTFLGAFIGVIISVVLIPLVIPLILILPTIGAISGFNLSKQKNKEKIIDNIEISENTISYKIFSF